MNILCTICSDLVNQAENIYVTKCGHMFHHHCLAQWIERSKSCPQCRHRVTEKCMFRMFPTISSEATADDAATLQSRLDDATLHLRQERAAGRELSDKLDALKADLKRNEEVLKSYEKKLVNRDSAISALKEQMEYLKVQNKETTRLKEENEGLKKNLQTLNGLQKVLNATSEEVEQMLEGYTDLKTVATFATALKRALCESESKKNESRDRLNSAKQQIAIEKSNVADMQVKIMHLEDKLSNAERKYEALKNKRKVSEIADKSMSEQASPKQPRRSNSPSRRSDSFDLNCAILNDSTSSLNSMVSRIENAESPYLSLRQSSLALSALQRGPSIHIPTGNMKPSEFAMLNAARNAVKNPENTSIFHKKAPLKPDLTADEPCIDLDVSYDGLGGHSKLDKFPVPKPRNVIKSCVPKLSAKHKLKRPTPPGTQDIGKLLERIRDK